MRSVLYSLVLVAALAQQAYAQQPVLPGAPQLGSPTAPMPLPRTTPLPGAEVVGHPGEVIGQVYSIETVAGTQFSGILREATDTSLTFETKELGLVTIQRANVRQLMSQTPEQARHGFDYVGNGTRLFVVPTARNLYKGEGYVQNIGVFVTGINYGVTDHLSVGAFVPIIPFLGVPALAFTAKVGTPVGSDNFHVGAGVLYGFATGAGGSRGSGGVGYGLATYGNADANLTFGLGYGFSSSGISNTPVAVLGGNLRVSRLFSLVNETYIADLGRNGAVAGLLGARYAAPRVSASLGALYFDEGFYPAYIDVAFRFGKTKLR